MKDCGCRPPQKELIRNLEKHFDQVVVLFLHLMYEDVKSHIPLTVKFYLSSVRLLKLINICRSCGNETLKLQQGKLLDVEVDYYECPNCGYVQTEIPYWLDRAYQEAINDSDTGIMVRNQANARIVIATLFILNKIDGTVVDCAGGYGILVRLLRDYGINALWSDLYCKNLVSRGFEHANETAELITAFEVFEHFENPATELDRLLRISPNVLFSTDIIPDPAPKQDNWWYYGTEHGQHIGFFRIRTLKYLAQERGINFYSNGISHHLFTNQNINKNLWKLLIRANKLVPILLRQRLKSKTWSDHDRIAERKK